MGEKLSEPITGPSLQAAIERYVSRDDSRVLSDDLTVAILECNGLKGYIAELRRAWRDDERTLEEVLLNSFMVGFQAGRFHD